MSLESSASFEIGKKVKRRKRKQALLEEQSTEQSSLESERSSPPQKIFVVSSGEAGSLSDAEASPPFSASYESSQNVNTDILDNAKLDFLQPSDHEKLQDERELLPIFKAKKDIIKILANERCIIFEGETGSGKTTQIPQYIMESGLLKHGAIAVTQPRRVATILIAERVAKEVGCDLGQEVGYSVRFDNMTSKETKIKYLTDGMLLRESIIDPMLWRYSWIILDEAHERTIHTDILFGIVKSAMLARQKQGKRKLKVIIMSATLDSEKMSNYFNQAPSYRLFGRLFTVRIFNAHVPDTDYVSSALSTVFQIHINEDPGDILVFLTGEEEIQSTVRHINKLSPQLPIGCGKLLPLPLYASLTPLQQKEVLKPTPPDARKIVVSTNIAETSVTIPNIRYVIDSGMVKTKTFDPVCGMDHLKVQRVSKAQAEQRLGRAGREVDGDCYRLYTLEEYTNLEEFPVPEIMRSNLANVVLQIIAIGVQDVLNFDFLDKPSNENIHNAIEQLRYLGAIEGDTTKLKLTDLGRQMANFPLDPKFSKIIITSKTFKCTVDVLIIISMLSVETVFCSPVNEVRHHELDGYQQTRRKFPTEDGDLIMLLNIYKTFQKIGASSRKNWCLQNSLSFRGLQKVGEIRKQLLKICESLEIPPTSCGKENSVVRRCFAYGLFMNSAQMRLNKKFYTLCNNQVVFLHPSSALFRSNPHCVIYAELVKTSKCYMRFVSRVDEEWLLEACSAYFEKRHLRTFALVSV